jgi:hypothetical protein
MSADVPTTDLISPHSGESDATDWATGDPLRAALEMEPERPSKRQPKDGAAA